MSARVEIIGGGVPSDEEVAALVVALTPVPVVAAAGSDDGAPGTPAWAAAGLLEGVGGRPAASPADLTALR